MMKLQAVRKKLLPNTLDKFFLQRYREQRHCDVMMVNEEIHIAQGDIKEKQASHTEIGETN